MITFNKIHDHQSTGINRSSSNALMFSSCWKIVWVTTSAKIPFSGPSRTRTILCALPINCANFTGETILVIMAAIVMGGWSNPSSSDSTTTTSFLGHPVMPCGRLSLQIQAYIFRARSSRAVDGVGNRCACAEVFDVM